MWNSLRWVWRNSNRTNCNFGVIKLKKWPDMENKQWSTFHFQQSHFQPRVCYNQHISCMLWIKKNYITAKLFHIKPNDVWWCCLIFITLRPDQVARCPRSNGSITSVAPGHNFSSHNSNANATKCWQGWQTQLPRQCELPHFIQTQRHLTYLTWITKCPPLVCFRHMKIFDVFQNVHPLICFQRMKIFDVLYCS